MAGPAMIKVAVIAACPTEAKASKQPPPMVQQKAEVDPSSQSISLSVVKLSQLILLPHTIVKTIPTLLIPHCPAKPCEPRPGTFHSTISLLLPAPYRIIDLRPFRVLILSICRY